MTLSVEDLQLLMPWPGYHHVYKGRPQYRYHQMHISYAYAHLHISTIMITCTGACHGRKQSRQMAIEWGVIQNGGGGGEERESVKLSLSPVLMTHIHGSTIYLNLTSTMMLMSHVRR